MDVRAHGPEQEESGRLSLTKGTTVNAMVHGNWDVATYPAARHSVRSRCVGRSRAEGIVQED